MFLDGGVPSVKAAVPSQGTWYRARYARCEIGYVALPFGSTVSYCFLLSPLPGLNVSVSTTAGVTSSTAGPSSKVASSSPGQGKRSKASGSKTKATQPTLASFFRAAVPSQTSISTPASGTPAPEPATPASSTTAAAPPASAPVPAAQSTTQAATPVSDDAKATGSSTATSRPAKRTAESAALPVAAAFTSAPPPSPKEIPAIPYLRIAETFEKMLATKSRLAITRHLATLFQSVLADTVGPDGRSDADTLLATVYLCNNAIAPAHKG